jgi:nucleoside-diphosphate-sugar epimerase
MWMRLLLTGSAGFMGRNALLRLPHDWEITALYRPDDGAFERFLARYSLIHVRSQACDLSDAEQMQTVFKRLGSTWDQCLYFAANTSVVFSVSHPVSDLASNTIGLIRTLENTKIDHLVFVSSGAVYIGCDGLVGSMTPVTPDLPYAISKLSAEYYVHAMHTQSGNPTNATIVRFFGAYGPYELARKLYTRAVRAFAFERTPEFTVMGDGENMIDAMYVDDAIDAFYAIMMRPAQGIVTVDLGEGAGMTVNKIVTRAARAFDLEAQISHVGETLDYKKYYVDPQAFSSRYGVAPQITLEDGLARLASHLAVEDAY